MRDTGFKTLYLSGQCLQLLSFQLHAIITLGQLFAFLLQLLQYLGDLEFALLKACFQRKNLGLLFNVLCGFDETRWILGEVAQKFFFRDLLYIREAKLTE